MSAEERELLLEFIKLFSQATEKDKQIALDLINGK